MRILESGIYHGIQWREGSLLKEATTKYYKQQSTKSELLEVCYSGGLKVHRWRSGLESQMGQLGIGIPGIIKGTGVPKCGRLPRHKSGEAG